MIVRLILEVWVHILSEFHSLDVFFVALVVIEVKGEEVIFSPVLLVVKSLILVVVS